MSKRFSAVLVAILMLATSNTMSAEPAPAPVQGPVYAVLSLVGDQLDIVYHQTQTGSNLDQNAHNYLKLQNPIYDSTTATIVANAIRKVTPAAEVKALNTHSAVLYDKQSSLFEVSRGVMALPDAIKDALREQGATRVVLIGKQRGTPAIPTPNSTYHSAGKLEGLGYFIDKEWGTVRFDEITKKYDESGKGFIAPYAYIQITLAEVPSGRVLGSKRLNSAAMENASNQDDPWGALTATQKLALLASLLEKSVTPAVVELVTAAK